MIAGQQRDEYYQTAFCSQAVDACNSMKCFFGLLWCGRLPTAFPCIPASDRSFSQPGLGRLPSDNNRIFCKTPFICTDDVEFGAFSRMPLCALLLACTEACIQQRLSFRIEELLLHLLCVALWLGMGYSDASPQRRSGSKGTHLVALSGGSPFTSIWGDPSTLGIEGMHTAKQKSIFGAFPRAR